MIRLCHAKSPSRLVGECVRAHLQPVSAVGYQMEKKYWRLIAVLSDVAIVLAVVVMLLNETKRKV